MKARIWADVYLVHEGRIVDAKQVEFYVWDSGRDVTLSKKFLQQHGIADLRGLQADDLAIHQYATITPSWRQDQIPNDRCVLNSLNAHLRADDAADVTSTGGARAEKGFQGETSSSSKHNVNKDSFRETTTTSRLDAWTKEKAEALHQQLSTQLNEKIPALQEALSAVSDEFPDAFGEDVSTPSDFKRFKVKLKNGAQYVCMLPRRLSEPMLKIVQEQIETWLSQGVIRKSSSAFAFPLVLVKRNGKIRTCVDFRLLNDMTEPYPYAMPDLHEVLDKLAGKKYYWSVDVSSFFNQIEVEPESAQYLAFVMPGGAKYEFQRVPFGCKNAPAWAQQQLREALQEDESTRSLINFIDDITYGTNDMEDAVTKYRALLQFCCSHRLKLKRSKCVLGVPAVKALGFVLNHQGKWIDPERVMALLKLPPSRGVKELRHLLGSFNFVRQWLSGSADMCAPLFDLLKKDAKFQWGPAQDEALHLLKQAVATAPCLGQIDPGKPVYVRCDASDIGCACVLYQMVLNAQTHQEEPKAIAYAARRFSPAERRWCLAERESYSIKMAWEKFSGLLAGLHVIVETDHKNHLYMHSASSMKVQRWRMWLQQFDYEIRHLPGKDNEPADSLSRLFESLHISNLMTDAPTTEQARKERQEGIIAPSTKLGGISLATKFLTCDDGDELEGNDDHLEEALFNACGITTKAALSDYASFTNMEANPAPSGTESEISTPAEWEELHDTDESTAVLNDHVGHRFTNKYQEWPSLYGKGYTLLRNSGWEEGEWVGLTMPAETEPISIHSGARDPKDFRGIGCDGPRPRMDDSPEEHVRASFLQKFRRVHNSKAGHWGKLRTYSRLKKLEGFPWGIKTSTLYEMVNAECDGCLMCRKIWSTRGDIQSAGAAIIRQRPWTEVAIDLVVLDEPDEDGNTNIVVIVDSFSRAAELYAVQSGDAETVARCLYDVYNRYGRPRRVRCDGARAFVKSVVQRLNRLVGVEVHPILAYAPYQNGQVERYNQEVMRHLRTIVLGEDGKHVLRAKRWGLHTSAVRRLLNNTINSETGCTPNELLYGGYGDTEASLFVEDLAHEHGEPVAGWVFAKELEEVQFEILRRSEEHQEKVIAAAIHKAHQTGLRSIEEGTHVLCRRGGLGKRPKGKLQSRFTGPFLVLDRPDSRATESIVKCYHLGNKTVSSFHMAELVRIDLRHLNAQEMEQEAIKDDWTYKVKKIERFRPTGPRRTNGKLRPKEQYEFLVLYDLPRSTDPEEENPAWQPYMHVRHTSALKEFCSKQEVIRQLGGTFYVSDGDGEGD